MSNDRSSKSPEYLRLQAILQNAVDAIITIDEEGIIQSANPATTNLFQYQPEELLGQNINLLMPSPYREEHDQYIQNYIRSGVPRIIGGGREVVGRRKDGSTFPMHLAVSELTDCGRRFFTGIVRDITDLKIAQKRLAELNSELEARVRKRTDELRHAQAQLVEKEKLATLGQVAGGIAHEIRNPLNAIKTAAYYLLNADQVEEEKQKECLNRIDRQVSTIANVVTALSDVARLPEARLIQLSVHEIIQAALQEVTLPPEVSVQLDLPADLPQVMADNRQIPIVFRNLLCNARDAMPTGGIITISARADNDRVAISVRDTGIGIADDDLNRIIEPLYSTKARGMGLGLAICKVVLEKSGGILEIESEVGKGSTFTVQVPAATHASASQSLANGAG